MMYHFIKLGGSLITDKNTPLTPRPLVIQRLAQELANVYRSGPHKPWIIGHGSGSYGHVVGKRYRIRTGVENREGWQGFVETGYIAGQLHRIVLAALLHAGLPVVSLPPSALVTCHQGAIIDVHLQPIRATLSHGLIPLTFGDVAFDKILGGVIVSTEEVFSALADSFPPSRFTLVGIVDGVFDADPFQNRQAQRIPHLRLDELSTLSTALGGSHGVDVTGGMAAKIQEMAALLHRHPHMKVHLISGEIPGRLEAHLNNPDAPLGTTLSL